MMNLKLCPRLDIKTGMPQEDLFPYLVLEIVMQYSILTVTFRGLGSYGYI